MSMTFAQLKAIADDIKAGKILPPLRRGEKPFTMLYRGKVVGKERVRTGPNSHYTPEATRKFERAVKQEAKYVMFREKIPIYRCSIVAHITICDPIPIDWPEWRKTLARSGYVFSWDGADIDNREKAILDALNKVVYEDDRQSVQVFKKREYTEDFEGFRLTVTPTGLTRNDVERLAGMLGGEKKNN